MRTKRYDVFVTVAASYDLGGSVVPEIDHLLAAEYRQVIHTGYRIIYRESTQVFIVAVFHQRRDVKSVMMARALR